MFWRNSYQAGRKKRAKIERLREAQIPIVGRTQTGIFLSLEAQRQHRKL